MDCFFVQFRVSAVRSAKGLEIVRIILRVCSMPRCSSDLLLALLLLLPLLRCRRNLRGQTLRRISLRLCRCTTQVHVSEHMRVHMSAPMPVRISLHVAVHMSVCMSVHMSTHMCARTPAHVSELMSAHWSDKNVCAHQIEVTLELWTSRLSVIASYEP